MTSDFAWTDPIALDVRYGYLGSDVRGPRRHHPQLVLNTDDDSVLRALREELGRSAEFMFSVAFVTPGAIALLKQELLDFDGSGCIVTSDYLGFNSPAAFAELLNLRAIGIDVRIHPSTAFHPKGYIFAQGETMTALIGSANLTKNALVKNHEWNLRVSAAHGSDLAAQLTRLARSQVYESVSITDDWVAAYESQYRPPAPRPARLALPTNSPDEAASADALPADALSRVTFGLQPEAPSPLPEESVETLIEQVGSPGDLDGEIVPNAMQEVALRSIARVRREGNRRAIVISATGTGKTILSALDVRAVDPARMLFVVHREQILDRTIEEYRRVLGGAASLFGKLAGTTKQADRRYVFATIQTLSKPETLASMTPDEFDYVLVDEAHRAGSPSYQRVLDHLEPKFLLGMTATPERMDGFNVFELFDYNVAYEIRLGHALEEDMLSPFHYYGVADVTFEDGSTATGDDDLHDLISEERIDHLIKAIEIYGQAGIRPRGLIFCSRKDEARALAAALDGRLIHGRSVRTLALTGDDSVPERERAVERLESGELDYLLTVDVFNEGVDIPTVNQVIMLRQTKSAIVFVQQLGRGLRKAPAKDYLVVIDFIGNYANNFMIPIALFGDESLNKESLRKNLIASEEAGVLPGLSSVRFDKVSQERVLAAIGNANLESLQNMKVAVQAMRNRVGTIPTLMDFWRFESVDPVLLATRLGNYPRLLSKLLQTPSVMSPAQDRALTLLSEEVLAAKRPHELVLVRTLLERGVSTPRDLVDAFARAGCPASSAQIDGAVASLSLSGFSSADVTRLQKGVVIRLDDRFTLDPEFLESYRTSDEFKAQVDDLLEVAEVLIAARYDFTRIFTPGSQYSRRDTTRLLNWDRKATNTIYGYRTDTTAGVCPIFVTLHKSDEVAASTAYEDELLSRTSMRWFTRSRRTLESNEVKPIVANDVDVHVFVKKDDAEGTDFYYLGKAASSEAEETSMPGSDGEALPVVRMTLQFDRPVESALYDYFHPVITA